MAKQQEAEVIDLDSDEDSQPASNQVKKNPSSANCVNFECRSGDDMTLASYFVSSFYGANMSKKKKRYVCGVCLNAALDHQDELVASLLDRKPLVKYEFPDHTMEVEISDSDESDSDPKVDESVYIKEDVIAQFEKCVEQSVSEVFEKYDVNYQIEESQLALKAELGQLTEVNVELDRDIKESMAKLDKLRSVLYNEFKPNIKNLEEIVIDDTVNFMSPPLVARKKTMQVNKKQIPPPRTPQSIKSQSQDSQPEILQEVERDNHLLQSMDLPPSGPLVKPIPQIDDFVFTMKHPLFPWIKGKVQSIISKSPMQYRVKLLQKKYAGQMKMVNGKQMASNSPSPFIIPVGTRVVAIFQDVYSSNYYSGVVAEAPKSINKYRYLIFFDDGYAQYVKHKHIFLVCESSGRVWEDIPIESRDFIKKYLESYPERPMVKLQKGQVVKTEWNGKWWIARVSEVDASLVHMHFDADDRTEWIYRGSARLGPLYLELMKANLRQQGHHSSINTPVRHRGGVTASKNGPYVEYTTSNATDERDAILTDKEKILAEESQIVTVPQNRAVARKSTAKRSSLPEPSPNSNSNLYNPNLETKSSHSIVYYQTQNKIQTKKFIPHKCGPKCVESISFTPDDLKGYSPLSIPLLCGWNRQLCKFPKAKKYILYQAPCGLRLRNMEELHRYLRITNCPMSVDLFEFDYWVHCLAEFVLDKCFVNIKDLSYGVENVPIACVNEIDHQYPDTITYTTQRQPSEDVHMNLDPEFLCCCDCEDDCADKSKCACWQLTIQGATLGGRVPNAAVGYVYKRLPEAVTTGIYECNSRCKCSVKTCLNRVVQHPLNLKLQVFKTPKRGWGIRCLNDIPLGSFICIYAGRLLTEQGANEGGKNYGDEYLAELDYVEVVEGIKEGYEEDALDPEDDLQPDDDELDEDDKEDKRDNYEPDPQKDSPNDSDDDFGIDRNLQNSLNIHDEDSSSSIRSRLRKRQSKKVDESIDKQSEDSNSMSKDGHDKTGSDEEEAVREPSRFDLAVDTAKIENTNFQSVRHYFGEEEAVYVMDAKTTGNIGRYLNHSCDPNVFVQNVFVDSHDVRFPWVAFFALTYIRAGQELTWNYSYDVGSIPGKVIICRCGASNCRGRLL